MVTRSMSQQCEVQMEADYRIAAEFHEREESFRLVYESYLSNGLVQPNPFRMRILPHHLLPSTDIFIVERAGQITSTVTLICDGELGLPMEAVYPLEIRDLQARGKRLGEVSCLASRSATPIAQCLELLRLMVQTARHRGLHGLAVAVHPRHVRFYERYLAFQQVGTETLYPAVCHHPAVALLLDFDRIDRERPDNYERFFGDGLPLEKFRPQPMDADQLECFRYLLALVSSGVTLPCRQTTEIARPMNCNLWQTDIGDGGFVMPTAAFSG